MMMVCVLFINVPYIPWSLIQWESVCMYNFHDLEQKTKVCGRYVYVDDKKSIIESQGAH